MISPAFLYLLSEWAIRLVMLVYVPQRRSAAAARTWLLLIFILPWPGLVLYAVMGRAYLPRRRVELQQRVSQRIRSLGGELFAPHRARPELPVEFQQSIMLAENLGDFPIVGRNGLELLPLYDEAVARLTADIAAARHHVHLMYYIFADDRTGGRVVDALAGAVQRRVTCRVLIDSMGSKAWRHRLVVRLRAAGVEVVELLPYGLIRRGRARMDLRNHRKIAIIDGHTAYVGSQNLVDSDFKPGIVYTELVARVTGPVVRQLQVVLLTDYYLEKGHHPEEAELFPPPLVGGTALAQVLPSGPGYAQANNQRLIVALLHAARQRVVITTPYFVPDETLLAALQTAVLRGVDVHLVVSQKADQVLVGLAQRSYYEALLEAGVHVHCFRPGLLHAKHLSIDDRIAVIGSSNLDLRSFLLNAEVMLIVYDAQVAADLRAVQEQDFAQSELLTLEGWRRRPFVVRTLQNIARLMDTLL